MVDGPPPPRPPLQLPNQPPAGVSRPGPTLPLIPASAPPGLAGALGSLVPGLGAVAVVVAISIRVLAAAAYDPSTALALVGSAGELTIIVGALLATLPYLALALVLAAMTSVRRPHAEGPPPAAPRSLLLAGGALSGVLLVLIAPWYFVVVAALVGPVLAWLSEGPRRQIKPSEAELAPGGWHGYQRRVVRQLRRGSRRATTIGVFVVAALFLTRLDVWAPTERLEFTGDQPPRVAYVMSVDGRWTTLLTYPERRVLRVPTDSVTTRAVCRPGSSIYNAPTGWEVVTDALPGSLRVARTPEYPNC